MPYDRSVPNPPRIAGNAVVEAGADVGAGTVVWDLSQVRSGASVGADCVIGRNVFVDAGVSVGSRCKVQNNALLYAPASVGDGVFIGPAVVLTNDRYPRAVGVDGTLKSADDWQSEGVVIETGASVGAGAVILGGVTVGRWALVAANAMVTRDVADFALVAGSPAQRIAWVGPAGRPLEQVDASRWRCTVTDTTFVEDDGRLREQ